VSFLKKLINCEFSTFINYVFIYFNDLARCLVLCIINVCILYHFYFCVRVSSHTDISQICIDSVIGIVCRFYVSLDSKYLHVRYVICAGSNPLGNMHFENSKLRINFDRLVLFFNFIGSYCYFESIEEYDLVHQLTYF
jgi:hypothetical protein